MNTWLPKPSQVDRPEGLARVAVYDCIVPRVVVGRTYGPKPAKALKQVKTIKTSKTFETFKTYEVSRLIKTFKSFKLRLTFEVLRSFRHIYI